ncbi:MAG TPA: phage holin family protein [Bacillota bacterium]|nr:phage holin family protein [Bacillota bacterium]
MRMLARLVLNAIALAVATWLVPGISLDVEDRIRAAVVLLVVALVFGLVNAWVKPIVQFVSIVAVVLTLGLFLLVINTLMLWLTSWVSGLLDLGWHVDGFWSALFGALIVSIVSVLLGFIVPEKKHDR